jgi:hypothetical protein
MDELKNFFADIRARLNSPLVGSYVLSWVVFNWRIPIVLFFYKQNELYLDKYRSFQDVIYKNTNFISNLILPLCVALAYTFLFPYVKAAIKLHQAKILTKNQDNIYDITYNAKTYSTKIDELNDAHRLEMQHFDLVKNELQSKTMESHNRGEDIVRYRSDIEQLTEKAKEMDELLLKDKNANSINSFNGKWKVTGITNEAEVWAISNGRIFIADQHVFTIEHVVSDFHNDKSAFMFTQATNQNNRKNIFFHTVSSGTLNGVMMNSSVVFERIPS